MIICVNNGVPWRPTREKKEETDEDKEKTGKNGFSLPSFEHLYLSLVWKTLWWLWRFTHLGYFGRRTGRARIPQAKGHPHQNGSVGNCLRKEEVTNFLVCSTQGDPLMTSSGATKNNLINRLFFIS